MKFILLILFLNLNGEEVVPDSLSGKVVADSITRKRDSIANKSLAVAKKFFNVSQTARAFKELLKAQTLYKESGNTRGEANVLVEFGKYYEKKQLWPEAESYYQKAFLLAEKDTINAPADIAYSLANTLFQQSNYKEALKFDTYALKQFTSKGLKGNMAECYVHIAAIKEKQGDYDEAEDLILHQALPLFRSADNQYGRISCFDVLGQLYHKQKRYSEAKWFFIQANMQSRKLKDTVGIIASLVNLAKVKVDIKDYDLALRDYREADTLSRRKSLLTLQAAVKKGLGLVYQKTGNKKLSQKYIADYHVLSKLIIDTLRNRTIAAALAKNKAEKSLRELNRPEARKAPTPSSRSGLYFLLGIIVLIIMSAILIFSLRKK
jgi:tetratricopeptide (TPR) repeat protein